jgi:hypothetical protein
MEKDLGKNGIMEYWKNGEKNELLRPNIPSFQHSNNPIFPHSIIPIFHYSSLNRERFHGLGVGNFIPLRIGMSGYPFLNLISFISCR